MIHSLAFWNLAVSIWEIVTAGVLFFVATSLVNQWLRRLDEDEAEQRALAQQIHPSVVSRRES